VNLPKRLVAQLPGQPANRRLLSRSDFVARAGAGLVGALLAGERLSAEPSSKPGPEPHWKGRTGSKVKRWDIITIGNLSRNRYWGESDARGLRSAICTCTLIQGEGFRLLVDPSLQNAEDMARELDRRTGLKLSDINNVFITHEHADHYAGLAHFPQARWLAGPEVASLLNASRKFTKPLAPASGKLFGAVDVVPTPGHTMGLHSLRFDCAGLSVVVAGDAVATLDFWRERRGYFNCVDFEHSARSMAKIAELGDIVVPGHDNYFLPAASPG
jgi:glyoxylase-like metal-dependent hydrolase (beta-lactamase superfamily II)